MTADDARWLHRPAMDWARAAAAQAGGGAGAAFLGVTRDDDRAARAAGCVRREGARDRPSADPALLMLERGDDADALLAVANFGAAQLPLPPIAGWDGPLHDLLGDDAATPIPPGSVRWLVRAA